MKWDDITIKQYYEIVDILANTEDPLEAQEQLIKTIWGVEMGDIPVSKVAYYINELSFLEKKYTEKPAKSVYLVKDQKFRPVLDLQKVTTAQYIDFQELLKRQDWKNILDCIFIKDGEQYGESKNADFLWENLTMNVYSDVMFFFLHLLNRLTLNTLYSSEREMRKMLRKTKEMPKRVALLKRMVETRKAIRLIKDEDELIG